MFRIVLESILARVDGAWGAMIMGLDGLPIDKITLDEVLDFEAIATELTTLIVGVFRSSRELELKGLQELSCQLASVTLVARMVHEDYFLLVALRPEGNFGRARYELRRGAERLRDQF
jgi:predicted regulator of Ras-like GTPase activity (Roadblock/LC7/MglB family)